MGFCFGKSLVKAFQWIQMKITLHNNLANDVFIVVGLILHIAIISLQMKGRWYLTQPFPFNSNHSLLLTKKHAELFSTAVCVC